MKSGTQNPRDPLSKTRPNPKVQSDASSLTKRSFAAGAGIDESASDFGLDMPNRSQEAIPQDTSE